MRRFAEIDSAGTVLRVIVADSAEWCEQTLGGTWIETFKDRSQRTHFAGIGFTYDEANDRFLPPRPFGSWVLDEEANWQAPIPMPEETDPETGEPVPYVWDEAAGEWVVSE